MHRAPPRSARHAIELGDDTRGLVEQHEHEVRNDGIERAVRERQLLRPAPHARQPARERELVGRHVDADRARPEQRQQVPVAATEVEDAPRVRDARREPLVAAAAREHP